MTLACETAEQLLCDRHDGVLDDAGRAGLDAHLTGCARCRELAGALAEVLEALRGARSAADGVPPAADLAERAATAALRAAWAAKSRAASLRSRAWQAAPDALAWVRSLAAVLTVATTAAIYLGPSFYRPARLVNRTVRAGAYLAERKAHLVEDFRLLRVVIATAFEGRLDRVNDRVEDYRRLIERRREVAPVPGSGQGAPAFSNFADGGRVEPVPDVAARARPRRSM